MAAEGDTGGPEPGTEAPGGGGREPLNEPIGERLRKRRLETGMSMRALARKVGVSASLISQIEHGKAMPSVATLYATVSELGLSLDELFFDNRLGAAAPAVLAKRQIDSEGARLPASQWQAPSDGPVLRAHNRLRLTLATGVIWERLTASHDLGVEFLYCTYPIGGESAAAEELMTHEGSEYGIILEGRCGATVGEETYELGVGDSIAFDSRTPHRIWNLSDEKPMVAIWTVVGRDGDPRVG